MKDRQERVRYKSKKVSKRNRLSVFRSNNHLYAQLIDDSNGTTLASASSLEKSIRDKKLQRKEIAELIGKNIAKKIRLSIYSSRPGIIIGKKGADIETLKNDLSKMSNLEVFLDIKEVRKPEVEARLVAENIASQLEKRISFRRAMKKAVQSAMRLGAKGVKIVCSGRLGGAEIARTEKYHEGSVPLHTLRGDIDYATAEAETTYGICGIKVWINKGEILLKDPYASEKKQIDQGSVR